MKQSRYVALAVLIVGCLIWFRACSQEYSADPISAQVVDAETGKPLPGVSVVAHWQLEGGLEGGSELGAVMVMEAETDANGKFSMPAWGPKRVYQSPGVYGNARIKSAAPEIFFFKSGYENGRRLNYYGSEGAPSHMRSEWDGKVIPLKPFHGELKIYADSVRWFSDDLVRATAEFNNTCAGGRSCPAACQWEHIPKTIAALRREEETFASQGMNIGMIYDSLVTNDSVYRQAGCASPAAVFKGKGK
jgi:hypothetical protein